MSVYNGRRGSYSAKHTDSYDLTKTLFGFYPRNFPVSVPSGDYLTTLK